MGTMTCSKCGHENPNAKYDEYCSQEDCYGVYLPTLDYDDGFVID